MLPPRARRYFRLAVRRPEILESDVGEEIAFHLEQRIEQLIRLGVPPEKARDEALRRFGRLDVAQAGIYQSAQHRENRMRVRELLDALRHDARQAVRSIRMSPGFTFVIALTLAVGIGANTAIFSVVDAVLLRPLPYPAVDRVVVLGDRQDDSESLPASYPEFLDWRTRGSEVFTGVGAYFSSEATLTGAGEPEVLTGVRASVDVRKLLGVTPLQGRWFRPDEEVPGAERVTLISEALWSRRFGRDPGVIGKVLTLNGNPHTVIGVMPSTGRAILPGDLVTGRRRDLWLPLRLTADAAPRGLHFMTVLGQLRPGVELAHARVRIEEVAARLRRDSVTTHGIQLVPVTERVIGDVRSRLGVILAAVGLVLLIACANVANLLLGRAAARQRDIGVRIALGASRARVVGQLLIESVLRAVIGGVFGVALAYGAVAAGRQWLPTRLPRADEVAVDGRVLLYALGLSILTGLLFGIFPALRAASQDAGIVLRDGGRGLSASLGRDRVRTTLVIAEVALSFVLLVHAGLLIRSFGRLASVDTGFDDQRTLTALILLPQSRYADSTRQVAFFDQALDQVRALPGVRGVALTSSLPVEGGTSGDVAIEGMTFPPDAAPSAEKRVVSPNYFEMLGTRMLSGRPFDVRDRLGAPPVIVVNESFARKWFPNGDAIGRRVAFSWGIEGMQTVIGVVADIREGALDEPAAPAVYVSYAQRPIDALNILVRTAGEPLDAVAALRRTVLAIDPNLPITQVRTLTDVLASGIAGPRLSATLLAVFSVVAMFLAALGLYGVVSFSVLQRTREIGIRAALGAQREDILRLVLGQGLVLVTIGLGVGLLLAVVSQRLIANQLFGIGPHDPMTFSVVGLTLAVVALGAAVLPALRATRIDPLVALREE